MTPEAWFLFIAVCGFLLTAATSGVAYSFPALDESAKFVAIIGLIVAGVGLAGFVCRLMYRMVVA